MFPKIPSPLIIAAIIILGLISSIKADELALKSDWLFKLGDDSAWANPAFGDSDWYPIKVPGYWEDQDYEKYDGFAWYRYHFQADTIWQRRDSLILYLGKIDAADEAFLNGARIGASGLFPPSPVSAKNSVRRYSIPAGLLKSANVLAVRVYDDQKEGGIYAGPLKIVTAEDSQMQPMSSKGWQNSIYQLPFSNGIAAACYNLKNRSYSNFFPHIYHKFDEKSETPNLISRAKVTLYRDKNEIDLAALKTVEIGYIAGTGIVKHILSGDGFILTQYGFCPFTLEKPFWIFFAILQGKQIDELSLNFSLTSENTGLDIGKWAFQQGDRKWLTVFIFYNPTPTDADYLFLKQYKNEHPGFQALTDELDWWQSWQARTQFPENITPEERSVYQQSLAVLKMAQCREPFPAGGQIIAALPPGHQNYCRPRDQAFAVEALLLSDHIEEARQALQFIMNGRCGRYKNFQWNNQNGGIGSDYAVAIHRYLGNGIEESQIDDHGLTMQLDGFGLTLWNINRYIEVTEDLKFLQYYWPKISRQISDVLPSLIDATGLVRMEPGPWEKILPHKHYTYTSACIYRGLLDAALLARQMDDETRAHHFEEIAINLQIAMENTLIDPQTSSLKGTLEDRDPNLYTDAAAVEALNWIFNPQDQVTSGTLQTFRKHLTLPQSGRGYCRTKKDLLTNHQEWVFGDLRIISATRKATNFKEAAELQDWVTHQALNNFGLIPQYFDIRNADYLGVVPRCGLGAGVYIITLWRQ
jgi:GH15 family glucan-1,4-alpha-glucosidase